MRNRSYLSGERIKGRAAAGAALLDRLVPGWWRHVRLRPLNVNDCKLCITGQLFGDYDRGLTELHLGQLDAPVYGFTGSDDDDLGMWALTRAWKNEIRRRRYGERVGRAS
jgi:hypothetical protein